MALLRNLPARPRTAAPSPAYPRLFLVGALALVLAPAACKSSSRGATGGVATGGSGVTSGYGASGGSEFSGAGSIGWGGGEVGGGGSATTSTDTGSGTGGTATTSTGSDTGSGGGKF